MLDLYNLPTPTKANVQVFLPTSTAAGAGFTVWTKPRGTTMIYMMTLGAGGNGGNGAVGALNAASGGGGGGSGAKATLVIPAFFVPDTLYVQVGYNLTTGGIPSRITIYPDTVANNCFLTAAQGSNGGNASAGTPGAAGGAGASTTIAGAPLAGAGKFDFIGGYAGGVGNAAGYSYPSGGQFVTGGSGGGALPATAIVGKDGTPFALNSPYYQPGTLGGAGGSTTTTPGQRGSNGIQSSGLFYFTGGTGGGSSHGGATGAGLFGGNGGDGAYGCGGGGGGGCLTGGTAGVGGRGGSGLVVIIAW